MYDNEITIQDIPHCAACGRAIGATEDWHALDSTTDVCADCFDDMEDEAAEELTEEEMEDLDAHMAEMAYQRAAYISVYDRYDKVW